MMAQSNASCVNSLDCYGMGLFTKRQYLKKRTNGSSK